MKKLTVAMFALLLAIGLMVAGFCLLIAALIVMYTYTRSL